MAECGDETYKRRCATYFALIDADHDGFLTENDYNVLADRYIKLGKINEVTGKQIRRKLVGIFEIFFAVPAKDGPITSDRFADAVLDRGQEQIILTASQFFGYYFDLIDVNGDGEVSRKEFEVFAKCFQLSEEAADISFNAYDSDQDGKISYDEFVKTGTGFFQGKAGERFDVVFGPISK